MQLLIFLIILGVAAVTHASQTPARANGLRFLGASYNIIKGNPDGGQLSGGGVDPGLSLTRRVLGLTWDDGKTTVDGKFLEPDQVNFAHRSSCVKTTTNEVISGAKSYQDKLKVNVEASASYDSGLWNVAFSLSAGYERVEKETSKSHKVFFEEKEVCNNGTARYKLDSAQVENWPVTKDFAAAVCALPEEYDQTAYGAFIDNWGTDIVETVQLGTRKTTRYESSYTQVASYAMENIDASVSASGGYGGFDASLTVDVNKFKESMSDTSKFTENKVEFTSGGDSLPEPIGVKLLPIHSVITDSFFSALEDKYRCENLEQRRNNVKRVLKEYPEIEKVTAPQDPTVRIPLTWPLGTYGLPETTSGCPQGKDSIWHKGTRFHDTQDGDPSNSWSDPYDLAGYKNKKDMEQKFCMRTQNRTTPYDLPWPKGNYCVYKKGNCPEGLSEGYVQWDDEDDDNANNVTGSLPDGNYNRNTRIYYCCRNDGFATNAINLPTDSPFVLFKGETHECQLVHGTNVREEWFYWDNEDDSGYVTETKRPRPNLQESNNNLKIHFCYYTKTK
ncbi:uncharacterized protein LOC144666477 [Oculina patagonica]